MLFPARSNCTVAILAQGTSRAVAVTQAFYAQVQVPVPPSSSSLNKLRERYLWACRRACFLFSVPVLADRALNAVGRTESKATHFEDFWFLVGDGWVGGGGGGTPGMHGFYWQMGFDVISEKV